MFLIILFSIFSLTSGLYNARGQLIKKDSSNLLLINLASNGKDYPELVSWHSSFSCQQMRKRKELFDSLSMHTGYHCYLKSEYQYDICPDLMQADAKLASFALSADDKISLKSTTKLKSASKACNNQISFQYGVEAKGGFFQILLSIFTFPVSGLTRMRSLVISLTAIVVSFVALYPLYSNKTRKRVVKCLRKQAIKLKNKLLGLARYIEVELGWFTTDKKQRTRLKRNKTINHKRFKKRSDFKFDSIDDY